MLMGGNQLTLEQLATIRPPSPTRTHNPLPHIDAVNIIQDTINKYFGIYQDDIDTRVLTSHEGARCFATFDFNVGSQELDLSIGFRGSYDKSLSEQLIEGAKVVVCSNGMFVGSNKASHKNTPNVFQGFRDRVKHMVANANERYLEVERDCGKFKSLRYWTKDPGYRILGEAYGNNIINVGQFTNAVEAWDHSPYPEHRETNAMNLLNAMTHAIKKGSVTTTADRHVKAYKWFRHKVLG